MTTMTEQSWTTVEKTDWGDGPWMTEPDKIQWVDEATNLDCLIVRGVTTGALCGYVGLPPEHPYHGVGYSDISELDVHGGLSYSDGCREHAIEGEGVCHVPLPGRPHDVWWLGFDCGHYRDYMPSMEARMRALGLPLPAFPGELVAYRDVAYVRAEVTALAAQLRGRKGLTTGR